MSAPLTPRRLATSPNRPQVTASQQLTAADPPVEIDAPGVAVRPVLEGSVKPYEFLGLVRWTNGPGSAACSAMPPVHGRESLNLDAAVAL